MATPELRDRIDAELTQRGHGATRSTEWNSLRGEGDAWLNTQPVDVLADKIVTTRNRARANRLPAEPGTIPTNLAKLAATLSLHLADVAEQRDDVYRFRAAYLDGHTIPLDEVEAWITRAAEGVHPTTYVTVAAPDGWQPGQPVDTTGGYSLEVRTVEYPVGRWRGATPVRQGHALDHLRALADDLTNAYGWQPGQASAFVLAGAVPVVQMIHNGTHPARALVNLAIHPTLSPEQLAPMYAQRRARTGQRVRLKDETLDLVIFMLERGDTPGTIREWRRQHPTDTRAPKVLRQTVKTARETLDRWANPPTWPTTHLDGAPRRPQQLSGDDPTRRRTRRS
jgi:hypothetical protein